MSNDPSHGTPSPSASGDSPKEPDDLLAAEDGAAANDAPGGASKEPAKSDSQSADSTEKAPAKDPLADSDAHDSSDGESKVGVTRLDASNAGETSDGDSAKSDSVPDDPTAKGGDVDEASDTEDDDGHDKDHEWHDEHDEYNPEYDDPYHDEYDEEGKGREGEDAHYYQEDDYHHHDENHGSGHSTGGGVSGSGKQSAQSSKKASVFSEDDDDDWDDDDEEAGGPVKNFLEHLEDLRWVIIKCVVAVLVCMCLCLVGANKGVQLLTKPLEEASLKIGESMMDKAREDRLKAQAAGRIKPTLQYQIGDKYIEVLADDATFRSLGGDPNSTNSVIPLQLAPQRIGDSVVMSFQPVDSVNVRDSVKIDLPKLVPRGPLTPFMLALKTAFFGGFGLASPLVFFFIGQFVLPALHRHEKKYLGYGVVIGSGLFLIGASFAYLVITNLMLGASIMFADWLGFHSTIWIIDDYIAVILKLLLGVGLGFELPVVLLTLVKIGILDYQKLNALRAYAVVVILVLCAVLTPPDVISQVLMAAPLYLLYEISVVIAYIWFRQEQREEAAATDV